jgi:hypothetical protein
VGRGLLPLQRPTRQLALTRGAPQLDTRSCRITGRPSRSPR